jgi:hypothetical protein
VYKITVDNNRDEAGVWTRLYYLQGRDSGTRYYLLTKDLIEAVKLYDGIVKNPP